MYLRARYYDPAPGQFLNRDPLESVTRFPYGYARDDPLNNTDPSGLNKCEVGANPLRWVGNAVDCASKARAPDYLSLDIPVVLPLLAIGVVPVGIGPDVNVTVNRDGKVYLGPGASAGLAGFAPSLRGGWLNQTPPPCDSRVDQFTSGWSATGGGTLPVFGGFGLSIGETYGFGGTATEVGVGFGASAGAAGNYSWKLPWQLPGW